MTTIDTRTGTKSRWVARLTVAAAAVLMAVTGGILRADLAGAAEVPVAAGGVFIDVGGPGDATFQPDAYFTEGATDTNRSGSNGFPNFSRTVAHPIDQGVWNTFRFLESDYAVPGLTPGASYELRLYFLDWYWKQVSKRVFDVTANGATVLQDFDIIRAAGDAGGDGSY